MVAPWKTKQVDDISSKIKAHNVVGVVRISGIPSKQMQSIRKKLEGQAEVVVLRGNILKKSFENAGVKGMDDFVDGPSGVIVTDLNPFRLEKLLYDNKTNAPAKAGQKAPFDLVVSAGDTGLPAGPVIGELQNAGIKAKIQGGKIMVMEDSVVVKKGQPVPANVAPVLARLGIEPMEIMLKLAAAHEKGTIYAADILHVDEKQTKEKFTNAYRMAFNLSYNARYFNKDVIELLLAEAVSKARNLMINAEILNKETVGIYLARADAQAKALKMALPADWEQKKAEEAPAEEKPAETSPPEPTAETPKE
ncbi:MAG: 50S ribosomal protein L10 [Candidatus Altiarchaeota archaeon]|nr:50S ribosomal protein L10 [Candidatus Altiarchaeota archaeon]